MLDPLGSADRRFPDDVVKSFRERYGTSPEVLVRAPGRVILLGAHIDYSEGWVLTGAINRAVWLAASPGARPDGVSRLHSLDFKATANLDLKTPAPPVDERDDSQTDWHDYPSGVAWALAESGRPVPSVDAVFGGNVPIGAGVSSSAAVEIAFLLAWEALGGFELEGADRARLGMQVENAYLGIESGIMDQFSSLHGADDHLVFLDCRSLHFEHVPLPKTLQILVADSGVRRRLADFDYNDRRDQCRQAVAVLQEHLPEIHTLRDIDGPSFERLAHHLPPVLQKRARHAVEECERTRQGAEALRRGDLATFGELIRSSHASSRDLYEVTIPEIDTLATAAWQTSGCLGARLLGGGFGGCVVALVESMATGTVREAMTQAFETSYERTPDIFTCNIAEGAGIVGLNENKRLCDQGAQPCSPTGR